MDEQSGESEEKEVTGEGTGESTMGTPEACYARHLSTLPI